MEKDGATLPRSMAEALPDFLVRLLWDVDPAAIDPEHHRALIFERVMSRGGWDAMCWLRARYAKEQLAAFVRDQGPRKLAPRDLAYWALVCDVELAQGAPDTGGGRPRWAGP